MCALFSRLLGKPSSGQDDLNGLVEAWNLCAHTLKSTKDGILMLGVGVGIVSDKVIKVKGDIY